LGLVKVPKIGGFLQSSHLTLRNGKIEAALATVKGTVKRKSLFVSP